MIRVPKVLVVDDARTVRAILAAVLSPHCGEVVMAEDIASAGERVREHPDLSLVLCDVVLPDGNGLQLLEDIVGMGDPRPDVILMTARRNEADARRAHALGAIAYLLKPVGFRAVAQAMQQAQRESEATPLARGIAVGRAHLVGPLEVVEAVAESDPVRVWDIHDMSLSGAFLATVGPIGPGTELDLCLDFGHDQTRVRAVVVRVQPPDWGRVAGLGIAFRELDDTAREVLEARLAEAARETH